MAVTVDESGSEGKGPAQSLGGFTYATNTRRVVPGTLDDVCASLY
ncbi:MAG TPA: hypothetical protein PLV93_13875 [Microthrixaceae bacterium]|nr:hypothetical protein [Microthrixaceae bacterium]